MDSLEALKAIGHHCERNIPSISKIRVLLLHSIHHHFLPQQIPNNGGVMNISNDTLLIGTKHLLGIFHYFSNLSFSSIEGGKLRLEGKHREEMSVVAGRAAILALLEGLVGSSECHA
jgi:hypothetical protein